MDTTIDFPLESEITKNPFDPDQKKPLHCCKGLISLFALLIQTGTSHRQALVDI